MPVYPVRIYALLLEAHRIVIECAMGVVKTLDHFVELPMLMQMLRTELTGTSDANAAAPAVDPSVVRATWVNMRMHWKFGELQSRHLRNITVNAHGRGNLALCSGYARDVLGELGVMMETLMAMSETLGVRGGATAGEMVAVVDDVTRGLAKLHDGVCTLAPLRAPVSAATSKPAAVLVPSLSFAPTPVDEVAHTGATTGPRMKPPAPSSAFAPVTIANTAARRKELYGSDSSSAAAPSASVRLTLGKAAKRKLVDKLTDEFVDGEDVDDVCDTTYVLPQTARKTVARTPAPAPAPVTSVIAAPTAEGAAK